MKKEEIQDGDKIAYMLKNYLFGMKAVVLVESVTDPSEYKMYVSDSGFPDRAFFSTVINMAKEGKGVKKNIIELLETHVPDHVPERDSPKETLQ